MSRPLRLEFPGSFWHVMVRGNEKRPIFHDAEDCKRFLHLLGKCVERFDWILSAYALMWNHFHLAIQLTVPTLSRGMHWLNGLYAQYFNARHNRVGHLYQGRFKSILIERETYGQEVLRYVVLNPVRAKLVELPEEYEWSSHRAVIGEVKAPKWLAVDDVLAPFGPRRDVALVRYRAFVDAGIGVERTPWADLVGQMFLGSPQWVEQMQKLVDLKPRANDIPREQRKIAVPSMSSIVTAVAEALSIDEDRVRHGLGAPRQVAAWIGWNEALLTRGEIAAGLRSCGVSNVAKLIRQCESDLETDESLRTVIDRCVSTIRRKKCEVRR